jgi:hypothetical protein
MAGNSIHNSGGGNVWVSGVVGDHSSVTHFAPPSDAGPQRAEGAARVSSPYTGPTKQAFIRRLDSSALELADHLEIPTQDMPQGTAGSRYIWEAIERRDKFDQLPAALVAIGREDLVQLLAKGRRK